MPLVSIVILNKVEVCEIEKATQGQICSLLCMASFFFGPLTLERYTILF